MSGRSHYWEVPGISLQKEQPVAATKQTELRKKNLTVSGERKKCYLPKELLGLFSDRLLINGSSILPI